MSHYYVILSDSEESLEPLQDSEIRWNKQRFGLKSPLLLLFCRLTLFLNQDLRDSSASPQNDILKKLFLVARLFNVTLSK